MILIPNIGLFGYIGGTHTSPKSDYIYAQIALYICQKHKVFSFQLVLLLHVTLR